MRKLISALAVVLVFVMAFTITASAAITGTEVYQPVNGKYTITAQDDDIKDAMVGMVVIGAADPNYKVIDENTIRYIDQTTAGTNGSISFPSFKPMDLKTEETMYLVYIGGGELTEAKKMGSLAPAPTGVEITGVDTLEIGKDAPFTAAIAPTGAIGTFSWDSDNKAVATVDNDGKVTAIAKGTANITVTVVGTTPAITDTWEVKVVPPTLTGVAVNKSTLSLVVEGTETLTVTPVPAKAEITGTPTWTSDAPTIASVDPATGEVTAVAEGTANITVTVDGFSATCAVTVTAQPVGTPGDVDGSEEIDVDDALMICQHIAGWDVDINLDLADVDASEEIDVDDALLICQYIAGWDVTLQ